MPSHGAGNGPVHAPILAPPHLIKRRFFVGIALFFCAALIAVGGYLASGNFLPLLRDQAGQALLRLVPPNMTAQLGSTDVALFWPPQIGITYSDVALTVNATNQKTVIDKLSLGIEPFSLMNGKPVFNTINVSGVRYQLPKRVEGALPELKLVGVRGAFDAVSAQLNKIGLQFFYEEHGVEIKIDDVDITLPDDGYSESIKVSSLELTTKNGSADVKGDLVIDGYDVPIKGSVWVSRNATSALQARLSLNAKAIPMPWRRLQTIVSNEPNDHALDFRPEPLLADLNIIANDNFDTVSDELEIVIIPRDMKFKLGTGNFVPVTGQLNFAMNFAKSVLTIRPDKWKIGRSEFILNGGLRDSYEQFGRNSFDFELLANRGVAVAQDAQTPPVRFAAKTAGHAFLDQKLIRYADLELDSDSGTLSGHGDISLEGEFQTAIFELLVNDMSIAGVKQLWPAPVARAARQWVLTNLAGGRVVKGKFDIAEPLRRRIPGSSKELTGATQVALSVEGVRFDVVGDIPPVREADGSLSFVDGVTQVTLSKGTMYLPSGRKAEAKNGVLTILPANERDGKINVSIDLGVSGEARAIGELISFNPINAGQFYPFNPADLGGNVDGNVKVDFVLNGGAAGPQPDWSVDFQVAGAGSLEKIEGRQLDNLNGRIKVDPRRADFDLKGDIDGLPADIAMVIPFGNSGVAAKRDISLKLSTKDRQKLAPGLETIVNGTTPVKVVGSGTSTKIEAGLTSATLDLPWIGWAKGSGIKSTASFNLTETGGLTTLSDFKISGNSFGVNNGKIEIDKNGLKNIRFGFTQLSKDDNFSLNIERNGAGYKIDISGKSLDARAMMRHVRAQARSAAATDGSIPIDLTAKIGRVTGFFDEYLTDAKISMRVRSGSVTKFALSGSTKSGFPVFLDLDGAGSGRSIKLEALGAGEFLRFADIYSNVLGGTLNVSLRGTGPQSLSGKANITDFRVFNEPKLAQLVSAKSDNSQSLQQAVNREIDTREVKFALASSNLVFAPGSLEITEAVARGPLAGFVVQGTVFNSKNQTRLTGTFLPAYGLNSIFSDIPILGALLGNGRDRGLIGVTFKLDGSFDNPNVTVNPLSVIAPGIFRSIFEFK